MNYCQEKADITADTLSGFLQQNDEKEPNF